MNNIEMEKKLAEDGFNRKEIALLKFMTERDSTTYQVLIVELSKRFVGAIALLVIIFGFYGSSIFLREDTDFFVLTLVLAFAFIAVWFVAPLKLGAKAYFFRKKYPQL
ncbi:hypothetical protein [Erwinia psidii]|uniref:Uncharacterized protein n=1 Tax=Erwinia psidii TaxID=69224 RepID=A0A3N6RTM7_9GAMM|nr:hypothetical protein [Erwinia psidii]MCX8959604.1 hypothetical protein [Erwinia psidii]MCX8967462.1 hypothetical protein [Erwinia psidii]RQM36318.1 hypothetical protein EB241_21185 [Erwinia psidii]